MSIFLTSLKLEHDNISHLKVIISHMFVRHSCCLNWEASGFNVVVWFVNNIAIWAHSMHHTYIWCKSTFYPPLLCNTTCGSRTCKCVCVWDSRTAFVFVCPCVFLLRLRECTRLSLSVRVSVQTGVCGLFYVPPIINNIFTVDMSAFFASLRNFWFTLFF